MPIRNYQDILAKYKELRKIGPPKLINKRFIHPDPTQPRRDFWVDDPPKTAIQDLRDLAQSIKTQGLINPIIVSVAYEDKEKNIHHIIVDGERRFRAITEPKYGGLGRNEVLAQVIEIQDEIGLDLIRLSVQKTNKNWDPYDQAQAEKNLLDKIGGNVSVVAQMIGVSRQAIINHQLIFNLKPNSLMQLKDSGKQLTYAREAAKLILSLSDNDKKNWPDFEEILISKIITHRIETRDQVTNLIKAFNNIKKGSAIKKQFFEDQDYSAREAIEAAGVEWKNLAQEAKSKALRLAVLIKDYSPELREAEVFELKKILRRLKNQIDIFLS
jgi:ParB/RepB/Spo0J family partition protein